MFCTYCRYCSVRGVLRFAVKGEDAFIIFGFNNWKKAHERFLKQEQSGPHKEALLKIDVLKQESIHASLSKQVQTEQRLCREMLLKQLSSLKFLAKQGLAVRRNDDMEGNLLQILQLQSEDCPEIMKWISKRKYFSPDIVNEQISLMGLSVLRKLLEEI